MNNNICMWIIHSFCGMRWLGHLFRFLWLFSWLFQFELREDQLEGRRYELCVKDYLRHHEQRVSALVKLFTSRFPIYQGWVQEFIVLNALTECTNCLKSCSTHLTRARTFVRSQNSTCPPVLCDLMCFLKIQAIKSVPRKSKRNIDPRLQSWAKFPKQFFCASLVTCKGKDPWIGKKSGVT